MKKESKQYTLILMAFSVNILLAQLLFSWSIINKRETNRMNFSDECTVQSNKHSDAVLYFVGESTINQSNFICVRYN